MEACGWAWRLLPLTLLLLWLLPGTKSQVCSVAPTFVTVDENELPTQPLATVTTPPGQTVVVSSSSVPEDIFQIVNNELKLTRAPDYETHPLLTAILECKQGSTSVTKLRVVVEVRNINDVAPVFPFSSKTWRVSEDTKVGTLVIPEAELRATDEDGDMLFYNLSIQSPPDKDKVFSLVGINFPALKLDQDLDYETNPTMVFHLLARDTKEPEAEPGHTATATVIIQVIPADMRPPWFLPCQFTDGRICINAQYEGAVSAALMETASLIFEPGPVYAIDGDTAINEQIGYSIIQGNTDDVFQIGPDSGNITMTKAAPHPKTFKLVVQARQVHTGKYSVTQVTIHVVAKQQYPPRFPKALYRGWLPPGTGTNVAVRDAEDPDRELRLRAEDDDFPAGVPNSGLQYRITNSSAFRMSGEVVRTNGNVGPPQVFYLEAEVLDKLTSEKDLTVIEILIQDTKPTPPAIGRTTSGPQLPLATSSPWTPAPPSPGSSPESTTQEGGTQISPTSRSTPTTSPTQDPPKPSNPDPTLVPPHSGTTVKPSTMPPTQGAPSPGPDPTLVPPHSGTTVKPSAMPPSQGPQSPGPDATLIPPHSGTTVKPSVMPPSQGPQSPGPDPTLIPPHSGTTVKPSVMPPSQGPQSPGPGPTLVPPHSGTTVKSSTTYPTQYPSGPPGPSPSGGSQTGAPGGITGETSTEPGGPSPETGVSSTTSPGPTEPSTPTGGSSGDQEQQVTMDQMAIVGGVLGALLFLTLLLLGVFLYKRNVGRKKTDLKDSGYDNKTFKAQESSNWVAYPEPEALPQTLQDDPPGGFGRSSALPIPAVREAEKGEAQGSGKTTPEESRRASREESGRISGEESRRTSREESRRPSREESGRTSREESRRTSREESGKTTPEESRRTSREESGKTTPEESRRTSREESRRTSQEESGKTTPEESRRTSREESGRTSREESRRTSQEESRRASREESGKTSREESRRTSREESRRTSQEESGRTTPEESRRTSREESGKTTPEESRRTSREESGRTSREESRRTSREESGKTTPEESRRTSQEERGRTSREGPMRSILTKERKSDDSGYKAVWFREDIGAHVDVVVINSPVPEEPSGAPGELQMPTEAEVHEELEIGSEEPELVLVVSEEPEKLLMASVEPQLFSVAPRKEPMEDADQSPEENKTEDGDMEAVPVPAED
ncbi:cadherin-related family member 5 isoform X2 [Macrotis lagotis]|uniref:cadherin-related family member 5 isoform X2 n=1 Tax=Macrotis lagotis TaxID=92651 RepID=UPI003D6940A8